VGIREIHIRADVQGIESNGSLQVVHRDGVGGDVEGKAAGRKVGGRQIGCNVDRAPGVVRPVIEPDWVLGKLEALPAGIGQLDHRLGIVGIEVESLAVKAHGVGQLVLGGCCGGSSTAGLEEEFGGLGATGAADPQGLPLLGAELEIQHLLDGLHDPVLEHEVGGLLGGDGPRLQLADRNSVYQLHRDAHQVALPQDASGDHEVDAEDVVGHVGTAHPAGTPRRAWR